MHATDLLSGESRSLYGLKIEELLKDSPFGGDELVCVRSDGGQVPVSMTLFLIRDGAGTPIRIGIGMKPVTARPGA